MHKLLLTALFCLILTACADEDKSKNTNSPASPATPAVVMYSYNFDLSNAQPLQGASLNQTTVYIFYKNSSQYSDVTFYCCKGLSGDALGEPHSIVVNDNSAPFVMTVDLGQYQTPGTRELYLDARKTGTGIKDNSYANFTINIADPKQPATGSATLSWTPPSTRIDSSNLDLSELSGYRIYHGTSASNLTIIADINISSATGYIAGNLATGIHYFAVSTYDVGGRESGLSTIRSKTIN